MRERLLLVALVMFAATCGCVIGAEPLDVDWGRQPDHLVPLVPETGVLDTYRQLITKHLLVDPAEFGRMIWEPGWSEPEWVVSIYGQGEIGINSLQYRSYHIAVARARSSIWTSIPSNNDERVQKRIQISRKDIVIDRDFAVAVQRAWLTMLLRARYAESATIFTDAPTAVFSVECRNLFEELFGQITPPTHGLTKEMFQIGTALAKFCDIGENERATEREKLIHWLRAFERKARKA